MIKIENIETWGIEHALRGMRNPLNSWDRSDSKHQGYSFILGDADLSLMKRLYKAGTEHRKYLRQIFISMDITAPLYWWKEFDTYKIGTVSNSCSTMHKLTEKKFELNDFSFDKLTNHISKETAGELVEVLNLLRAYYLRGKDKSFWYDLIQLLPSSYNQRRTITLNYENAVTMINQRSGHKLDEWKKFVEQLKLLPYLVKIMEG